MALDVATTGNSGRMDDLLDLNFSASNQKPIQPQSQGKSSFDYLAGPAPVQARSSQPGAAHLSAQTSPLPLQPSLKPASNQKSSQNDAFSSLFGVSPAKDPKSLSMAERLQSQSSSGSSTPVKTNLHQRTSDDPWDFDLLPADQAKQQKGAIHPQQQHDTFGFGFPDTSKPTPPTQLPASKDSFELAFDDFPTASSETTAVDQIQASHDDNVLGELAGSPADIVRPSNTSRASPTTPASPPSSVPPHVLGQLVEMGFGISEAQSALLATYNTQSQEWDIQGAAEQILAIDVPDQDQPPSRPVSRSSQQRRPQSRSNGEDSLPSSSPSNAASQQQQNMSKEQLVAQASALGNSVFKMANSYWKAGNKAVKQAMDQRAQSATVSNAQRGASPADGRPKWMRDLPPDVQVDDVSLAEAQHSVDTSRHQQQPRHQEEPKEVNLFQDDALPPHPSERKQSSPTPSISPSQPTAPRVYQSSARRRVPQRSAAASPAPSSSKASASPSTPSKPRISYNRPQVSAPAQALTKSSQYRTTGNEHFKLGSYGEAESAYAMAIEALPDNHLAAILAYNNRANARLRNGNERAAIEDCSTVLRLALCLASSEVTAANVDVQVLDEDSTRLEVPGLNLREAVGKALGRRAQAHEAAEKWQAALSDWGLLQQAGASLVQPAGGQRIVSDGIARCRKMLAPAAATQKPAARPAPKRPAPQAAAKPSERLEHVRQDAAKVEAEDAQRLASKDEIDARIMAWKGGKETNLRALIASLDMVIWPELGWKSVGMHELITDNKLKINYMKAIARLHPDKLSASSTTVEQRMLANSAFAALNDAWKVSKS